MSELLSLNVCNHIVRTDICGYIKMGPSKCNGKDHSALGRRASSSPFLCVVTPLEDRSSTRESATWFDGVSIEVLATNGEYS